MRAHPTKSSLSPRRRRLLEWLQRRPYGRVLGLVIENGEPALDPPPRFERDYKLGGDNGPRAESLTPDFALKPQFVELFQFFDELGDGTITLIEVKAGLPFLLKFTETLG